MQFNAWDLAAIGIKAILYAATFCAAGGLFFLLYSRSLISFEDDNRVRRWVGLCAAAAIAASALRLLIVAGSMGDGVFGAVDASMVRLVLEAGEARATATRVAGLLLIGVIPLKTLSGRIAAFFGALLAASSFAWIGHAWAAGRWPSALLILHTTGIAFWLGALVPLLLVSQRKGATTFARTAKRFGEIAAVGVGVLLVAGSLLLTTLLRQTSDLWNTAYGRLIGGKLLLVALLLVAAAVNKLRFTPRLRNQDPAAARALRTSIRLEIVLGGLILVITATATTLLGPPVFN